MIKFENTEVMNFEGAIRGMRNPLNSWDKSDTDWRYFEDEEPESFIEQDEEDPHFYKIIGHNDLALMKKLIKAGSDHRKFMRQIFVSVDITAPLYWWKEFDTYKVATVSNSCSTMHKIHDKEFTLEDFSHEHLSKERGDVNGYIFGCNPVLPLGVLEIIVSELNFCRNRYIKTGEKKYWWQMIQLLPSSYNQRRTITLNYETLYNIYGSRRNHKLDEWSIGFMDWIKSLPYAEELIIDR